MKINLILKNIFIMIITLIVIPGFIEAESKQFKHYYFDNGTFYSYTVSTKEDYFYPKQLNNLSIHDWQELNLQIQKQERHTAAIDNQQKVDKSEQPKQSPETVENSGIKNAPTEQKVKPSSKEKDSIDVALYEQEVIRLTNIEREKLGLMPLKLDKELAHVARKKSLDMMTNGYFSHESPTYGSPFAMMESFDVTFYSAGENIARGQTSPAEVVQAWMDSEGHRKNILHPDYTHIGVGFVAEGYFWTQHFIKKIDNTVNNRTFEQQVVDLTNIERKKHGLVPLIVDEALTEVAQKKSLDMAEQDYFDHDSPKYGSPFDMMNQFGIVYHTAGENIARGQLTPAEVVQAWMDSEGHRQNILNPSFTHIGVGFEKENIIWTQLFIGKE